MKKERVAIIGEGAWGTAIATVLADNGHEVLIWCHDTEVVDQINNEHINHCYLPGVVLSKTIHATANLQETVAHGRWVFEALPVKYMRSVLSQAISFSSPDHVWGVLSKGIETETLLLPSQILDDLSSFPLQQVVFSGPSFAGELARKKLTSGVVVATDAQQADEVQRLLTTEYCCPVVADDFIGVQLCGALKNIFALGIGLLEGAGLGDNVRAFFLTASLKEMVQLVVALGGKHETAYDLSGIGDLVLTSMGAQSKNLTVGRRLGAGESLDTILQETGFIPEGLNTVISIKQLSEQRQLDAPLCSVIHHIIFTNGSLSDLLVVLKRSYC